MWTKRVMCFGLHHNKTLVGSHVTKTNGFTVKSGTDKIRSIHIGGQFSLSSIGELMQSIQGCNYNLFWAGVN